MFEVEAGPGPVDQATVIEADRAEAVDRIRSWWTETQESTGGTLLFHRPVRWVIPE